MPALPGKAPHAAAVQAGRMPALPGKAPHAAAVQAGKMPALPGKAPHASSSMLGPVHGASACMNRALGRFPPSPVRGTLLRRLTCTGGAHGPEPNHASQCSVPGAVICNTKSVRSLHLHAAWPVFRGAFEACPSRLSREPNSSLSGSVRVVPAKRYLAPRRPEIDLRSHRAAVTHQEQEPWRDLRRATRKTRKSRSCP